MLVGYLFPIRMLVIITRKGERLPYVLKRKKSYLTIGMPFFAISLSTLSAT